MKEHPSYPWDHLSDQPHIIRDKNLKRRIYIKSSLQVLKSIALTPLLPLFYTALWLKKPWRRSAVNRCIGLSVHMESECAGKTIVSADKLKEMVEDIGVKQLLVRIPLADSENFPKYISHIDNLLGNGREVTVNLIQSRLVLDDQDMLEAHFKQLLSLLNGRIKIMHIGNAYNRRKWAFHHFGEYYKFFKQIRTIAQELAPDIKLVGGSVIDFELPPFLESLFHFRSGHYDGYSSQLYVDRRGAPENKQLGCNFLDKINLISIMSSWSWKAKGDLWITEINWPLKNTAGFAPCRGSVLVNPNEQANYLARAYLLAIASGNIRTCYWHQLIAPGYGLVDNRENDITLQPSYMALKTLISMLEGATVEHFSNGKFQGQKGLYRLSLTKPTADGELKIKAFWSHSGNHTVKLDEKHTLVDQYGTTLSSEATSLLAESQVIYAHRF